MAISYNDYKKDWQKTIGKEIDRINSGKLTDEERKRKAIVTSTPFTVSPKLNLQEKKEAYNTALNKSVLENEKQLNQELKNRGYNSLNPILPYSQKDRLSKNSEEEKENRLNVQNELLPIFQNVRKNTEEVRENLNQASNDLKLAQYQYDVDRVENEETTFWDKTGGNITRALADMGSIFTAGSNKYVDENGNTIYLPSYNDLKQQKVREDYDTGIGRLLGDVAYNSTKILASTGLNVIAPGAGSVLYWSDMFTDNLENAKSQGYGDINSIAYAITGTGMEYLTGKFLGSATKRLTGGQASTLEQALNKGFNKIVNNKTISNVLAKAGSEGVEEFLQEYLENLNKVVMLDEEPSKVLDVLLDTDILGDALYSAAVGAISGGALSFVNGESNNDVNTILKQQLEQKYKETKDTSQKAKIKEAIDLIDKQNEPITVQELVQRDMKSNQNDNTINLPPVKYSYTETGNKKIDNLNKSMTKYFNNSEQTRNLADTISKVIEDKNYNVTFDDKITNKLGQPVNAQITTNKNGEIDIKINPNSPRAGEFLLVHEITHAIENNSMKKLILDYASKNPEFNQALESLKQTYGTNDVSSEVVADISGQLFGNQEFINNLSMEQPSVFRKIYNKIIELANKITGNSREALFIRDLRNKWEEAYRTQNNNLDETKYMITGLKGAKNATNTNSKYNNALMEQKNAEKAYNSNKVSTRKIRQQTGWYKDTKTKQWKFEISDDKALIKGNQKYNQTYNLDNILTHEELFNMYPKLKNMNVTFKDINSSGKYNRLTKSITLNNKLLNNVYTDELLGTLLHEVQHAVQDIEGFSRGTSSKLGLLRYVNNRGEIEAANTKERINLTDDQRKLIAPETAKKNPKHPDREKILKKANPVDKTLDKIYNLFNSEEIDINEKNTKNSSVSNLSNNRTDSMDNNQHNGNRLSEELDNSSFSLEQHKQKQFDIILKNNPVQDDYHTWIRSVDDIKTFKETLEDTDYKEYYEAGEDFDETYTADMAKKALETGKITVYSSYPIEQGIFVSPSQMEAESYSGTGKVYSKEVSLKDVAWIDPTQGQYAKVSNNQYSQQANKWQEHLEKNYKATGTRTDMRKLLPTQEDIRRMELKNTKLPTKRTLKQTVEGTNSEQTNQQTQQIIKNENINPDEKVAKILEERPITSEDKDSKLKKLLTIKILDKGYYVDKLARQTKNNQLSSTYDYMLQANGIAQQNIGNERFNPKTQQYEGKGLYKIFEPIENSGELQDFSEYMYHKHNIDRMRLDSTYGEDNKPIFGDTVTSDVSQEIVTNYEKTNPEFKEWAQEIYDYNNFLLDVLVDYGVITAEDKAYYNKKYPNYVPTIRATDKTKTQMEIMGKKASINVPIKKAKGGNQDIIPLKEAMALRTMQTMNSALRNNFGNELYKTIGVEVDQSNINLDEVVGDNIDVDDFLTKSTKEKPATLTIFKDGQKTTFDISDEIYESLAPSQRYKLKIFNTISRIRRGLLTEYNPAFMLTNPIKDIQDGSINSKHPTLFLKNIPEAIKQIQTKGEYYKQYIANGGSYETYFNYGDGYNKLPTKRAKFDPRKILDKISNINQSIEMTPRLAEFISSIEAGDTIETAMYNAQEITTNFKRGGNWTKNLDANGVTFLNASVQGMVKQIRNIQEAKAQGIKGVTNLAVKWSIAGLTPYILSQLLWGDDDDYEELSDYVKNNYYLLWKNNDGTFIRIPKGRVTSVIQNLFEQPLDALKGEKIDIPEFLDLLQTQVLPSNPNENNIFSPLIDVATNKTWYGGDLVPQRLQNLPSAEQYDESTDAISIWIGQKTGISPIKINYILDQYSGAIGDIILPTLTLEAENDSNSFLSVLSSPLKSKFTTDSVMNNQNISDLYDLDDELTKKSKSANATSEDKLKSKYINSIQTEMNLLSKEQREIQNDRTLTNNEKYKQVKEIQKEINKLAKEGINNYNDVEVYEDYGRVAGIEYYLNSKNEWTKVSDKEVEALNNLNMSGEDKNKYFSTKVQIGVIKSDENKESLVKKQEIGNLVINSDLSDEYKGFLYSKYYSSEETIDNILKAKINIDEFIKFNSQEFTNEYYLNGKVVPNSKKNKIINYVNSLNLSIPQKAMLIKTEYSSYDNYDTQIINYVNNMNYTKFEKASLLKQFGFNNYDDYIINYINSLNITLKKKTEMLENLGFTVRNGRVYS